MPGAARHGCLVARARRPVGHGSSPGPHARPVLVRLGGSAALPVLLRADDNPAWVGALPVIQVVWVNTHALFVLGPIILGLYVIDRVASVRPCGVVGPGKPAEGPARGRRWLHIGGATV